MIPQHIINELAAQVERRGVPTVPLRNNLEPRDADSFDETADHMDYHWDRACDRLRTLVAGTAAAAVLLVLGSVAAWLIFR